MINWEDVFFGWDVCEICGCECGEKQGEEGGKERAREKR